MNGSFRNAVAVFILINLLLPACQKSNLTDHDLNGIGGEEVVAGIAGKPLAEHVPNELLVKFKPGTTADQRKMVFGNLKAEIRERILTAAMKSAGENDGIYLLRIPVEVLTGISQANRFGEVDYAEPNYIYRHQATSNDPYYTGSNGGNLWGMWGPSSNPKNDYGISAETRWALNDTGSSAVCVGIIDEGFMFNHTDLNANSWVNPKETVNGKDDDGNGYVDDIRGWDFVRNDNTTFDGSSDDHGTHVAGTIGARGGNGVGVVGVCWNVKMISGKFLGNNGGTTSNAVKAVDYMTNLKKLGVNIVATNNSWGGGGYTKSLEDAIERANTENILFVAAAGNASSNNDATAAYPASYNNSNIIAVASITSSGGLSSFSNYGATRVDLGAPGSGIYSTLPATNGGSTYGSYSGTSMATPHVTGACALYKSMYPSAADSTIKSAILSKTIATSSLSGKCVSGGRLNVAGFK